ncbi:FAD dependent oxidoreductase [Tenacibaculum maritimum]|uniref:FAD dependent oxidoreductase n=1 Tax=Tenacibaculum maritimum NCIMB 2154 TaxID=1349785 RepID=A0A2H1EE26_9FLAO|nr:FAD-dependent oxidoreductase [Tenacibaculum maritimum]SFZ85254.1 FAD dependent oxidoreductase [Tenacibaculum maritimum NCIMB 2154]CAA0147150.1 FAD dependent oxidoreductase [Tenacibaculum maritimum]CAA0154278.1 FAD dependent oxidoreductase [Tenacibaculum maritimum]CAA0154771.1 FAD dependent oxidoreductase [Tenacibaculum maritimum]CAA0154971.1 FAD dependent oxidoreductase [Tenacibaculum maritimum]
MIHFSYWELKEWFTEVDFTVIGSGIVGLSCALELQKKHPKSKILILEKGVLPQGASTKNAGFACFGSLSELIDDLKTHTEEEVFNLVKKRWEGLKLLRKNIGDKNIDFQQNKGFELFRDKSFYEECLGKKKQINKLLYPLFKAPVFSVKNNFFQFSNIQENYIVNQFEGQIDTGKMMAELLLKVQKSGIRILNSTKVERFNEGSKVVVETDKYTFKTNKLFIATNGFAKSLLQEKVQPARAQVLITSPIENLRIKGTFHLDKGYYYFRNINNRILFGGGRNLDFKGEETTTFGKTEVIQSSLEKILKEVILPKTSFQVAHRWSGIMGVGSQKKAIVKQVSENVFCGVRLGGMGVAIGSLVGKELAGLLA